MNNEVHRFKRGNNLYEVSFLQYKPDSPRGVYVVFRINKRCERFVNVSYKMTRDSSIYDFCDEEEAKTLKRSDTFYKKHIEAKRKAVALFRKK